MDSFTKVIQLTAIKVDKLNAAIVELEEELHQKTTAEQTAYLEHIKTSFIPAWLWRMKTPKVYTPTWRQDQSKISLRSLLDAELIDLNQLAAELNLYVLNVAIYLSRLKADKSLVMQAEELRQLSEQLRNVSIPNN